VILPLALLLWGFTPFTQVQNVCPDCPKAKSDVVELNTGLKIRCTVAGQNQDYYILDRFGEYRAVAKTEVKNITWKEEGGLAKLGAGDQIITKNNIVYHGAIVQEQPGRYFVIHVGDLKHSIWHSQIKSVYKGGNPYPLTAGGAAPAPTPTPAPAVP
jgi:hypothetical protein